MNRRERASYAGALTSMRRWAREERPEDWTAEEWDGLVEKAIFQKSALPESPRFPLLRPLVSAAAALIVLVWAALFLLKSRPANLSARNAAGPADIAAPSHEYLHPDPEIIAPTGGARQAFLRPAAPPETFGLLASAARTPRPSEDKPAFTWISPDTGLQIVWFTNNNLKLEDHQ